MTPDLGVPEGIDRDSIGIVIVDHGSRRDESNRSHEAFVMEWRTSSGYLIVEPAHMELAAPSIGTAFDGCVAAGAEMVVIAPYFLGPGNHWDRDIPALAAEASSRHPGVGYLVTAPLVRTASSWTSLTCGSNSASNMPSTGRRNANCAQARDAVDCCERCRSNRDWRRRT